MHVDSAVVAARSVPARSRVTNNPRALVGMDGRTAAGRRLLDLMDAFTRALGGAAALTEARAADVRRAAELTLIAEDTRVQALKGAVVDLLGLVRIEGAADRAVRRLGIDSKPQAFVPLRDRLAAEAAEGA